MDNIDFDLVDKWFSIYDKKEMCGVPYSKEDGYMWYIIELARWAREYVETVKGLENGNTEKV